MKRMIFLTILIIIITGCDKETLDKESPTITFTNNDDIIIYENEELPKLEYQVFDNLDKKVKVLVTNDVDNKKTGVYHIKYEAIDKAGNKTKVFRKVTVLKKINIIDKITYVKGILVVNKKYHLPSDYNPNVNKEALDAHHNMQKDSGFPLKIISGFRSYSYQKKLFDNYAAINGIEEANRFSAKAGESEHQTGLAFDLTSLNQDYGNTKEGIWLKENCYKYGFIIRYPLGKENITGYMYEPWHIRYVGIKDAKKIYESNKTLEEYLDI